MAEPPFFVQAGAPARSSIVAEAPAAAAVDPDPVVARHAPGAPLDAGLVRQLLDQARLALARALFPYVVVDLDHTFREEQTLVLRQADVILLILRLDFTALRNAQRALDYLAQMGISSNRIRVVVNRYGQPKEVPAAKAEEALGVRIFHYIPDDPTTVNGANNNGVPVVLHNARAKVSRSITQLAASVNGRRPAR